MKTYTGESFFFSHGNKRGVILLHAYTGNSNDVRMLGRSINKQGYNVYAPLFSGHGGDPRYILQSAGPRAWWDDTQLAILKLRDMGIDKIAIFGLSLGGLLATKALENDPQLVGGGVFASPITSWGKSNVPEYFPRLAAAYYRRQGLNPVEISNKLDWLSAHLPSQLAAIEGLAKQVAVHLDQLHGPFFIAQGGEDEMINPLSGKELAQKLKANGIAVDYHFYSGASHLLTINSAHRQLFADVEKYLQSIFEV